MIAFIFPGQGSQAVGMGKALAEGFDICRETFAEADAALGEPLSRLCFEGPEDQLRLTVGIRCGVELLETDALPRWDHKARRFKDERTEVPF